MWIINSILKVASKSSPVLLTLLFVLLISMSGAAQSEIRTYTNEATYLTDLAIFAPQQVQESFEGSAWDSVRSTIFAENASQSITNLGLTWRNRFFPVGGVTTSDGGGNPHEGFWQFYAAPHGGYGISGLDCTVPGECSDGFTVISTSAGTLYGVGGWFTGAAGAEIDFYLDDNLVTGAGGSATITWQFYGVIDTNGFNKADIKEISGTQGDNNFIWADDFTIGAISTGSSPLCDIQMNQATYTDGDTITANVFRIANLTAALLALEWKVWLGVPGFPPISIFNLGADGTFVLPAGTDYDFGPVSLFSVTAALPRGSYELSCRMLDPVTGELLAEDRNFFDIQ
jgi:hypothetical protein